VKYNSCFIAVSISPCCWHCVVLIIITYSIQLSRDPNVNSSRVIRQRLQDSGPEWDLKVSGPEWDPNLLRPEWLKLSFNSSYNPRLKILIKYKVMFYTNSEICGYIICMLIAWLGHFFMLLPVSGWPDGGSLPSLEVSSNLIMKRRSWGIALGPTE